MLTDRAGADAVGPDPDLLEAACLIHDIGHPPFGHIGEHSLCATVDELRSTESDQARTEGSRATRRIYGSLATLPPAPEDETSGASTSREQPWTPPPSTRGAEALAIGKPPTPVSTGDAMSRRRPRLSGSSRGTYRSRRRRSRTSSLDLSRKRSWTGRMR
ncbi:MULTISPECIES: HD domain-containing protein [unclassified Nocardioides]|uniref:HD domain-containing protein n=1 Tax=unclassified Nocardioides TaxID=2615069 RepID=UPI00360725D3